MQFSKNKFPILLGNGGDEEIRTPDPLLARQVLSQLSYTPTYYPTSASYEAYCPSNRKRLLGCPYSLKVSGIPTCHGGPRWT